MKKVAMIGLLHSLLRTLPLAAQVTTFDPGVTFSLTENPYGVWEYGYSATSSLAPGQFRPDKHAMVQGAIGFWQPDSTNHYPYVAFTTSTSHTETSPGWAIRPGEVAMEGGGDSQYSLVRFAAPRAGTYRVTARFEGIQPVSTTDVHILHNGTSLLNANIDGYGGDSTVRTPQGSSPVVSYSGDVELKNGDTITFAVGVGTNKSNYGDTTGLIAKITLISAEQRNRRSRRSPHP